MQKHSTSLPYELSTTLNESTERKPEDAMTIDSHLEEKSHCKRAVFISHSREVITFFKQWLKKQHEIVAVVTDNEDIKNWINSYSKETKEVTPNELDNPKEFHDFLKKEEIDVVFSLINHRMIHKDLLELCDNDKPPIKVINYHAGTLPQYRGVYGTSWVLWNNRESSYHITWHKVDEGIDTGPVYVTSEAIPIDAKMTGKTLEIECLEQAKKSFSEVIKAIEGDWIPTPQKGPDKAYFINTRLPDHRNGLVDASNQMAEEIERLYRALTLNEQTDYHLGVIKLWLGKRELVFPKLIEIIEASAEDAAAEPGVLLKVTDTYVNIKTTAGCICLKDLYQSNGVLIKDIKTYFYNVGLDETSKLPTAVDIYKKLDGIKYSYKTNLVWKEYLKTITKLNFNQNESELHQVSQPISKLEQYPFKDEAHFISAAIFWLSQSLNHDKVTVGYYDHEVKNLPKQLDIVVFANILPLYVDVKNNTWEELIKTVTEKITGFQKKYPLCYDIIFRLPDLKKCDLEYDFIIEVVEDELTEDSNTESKALLTLLLDKQGHWQLQANRNKVVESQRDYFEAFCKAWCINFEKILNYIEKQSRLPDANFNLETISVLSEIKSEPSSQSMTLPWLFNRKNTANLAVTYIYQNESRDECCETRLTADAFYNQVNALVCQLQSQDIKRLNQVIISLPTSLELIIAECACLQAGVSFVLLDLLSGKERLQTIIEQLGFATDENNICQIGLISKTNYIREICKLNSEVFKQMSFSIALDSLQKTAALAHGKDEAIPEPSDLDHLAYILFTSGTLGNPKGVMINRHQLAAALNRRMDWYQDYYKSSTYNIMALTGPRFDASIIVWLATLADGHKLILIQDDLRSDVDKQLHILSQQRINHLICTPHQYYALLNALEKKSCGLPDLQWVTLGGASWPHDLVDKHKNLLRNTLLINEYGLTETTCLVTIKAIYTPETSKLNLITLGNPLEQQALMVVDDNNNPVLEGMSGELLIIGDQIAQGYLSSGKDTSNKDTAFIDITEYPGLLEQLDLIKTKESETKRWPIRGFLSGDRARYCEKEGVIIEGRLGKEIKLRGQRIDLHELEKTLLEWLQKETNSANLIKTVYVTSICKNEKVLIAIENHYVDKTVISELNFYVRNKLVSYLPNIPVTIAVVPLLPINLQGKVDENELIQIAEEQQKALSPLADKLNYVLIDMWNKIVDGVKVNQDGELPNPITSLQYIVASKRFERDFRVDSEEHRKQLLQCSNTRQQAVLIDYLWQQQAKKITTTDTILLTGATGFLGSVILQHLLKSSSNTKIICLVRCKDELNGSKRIYDTLKTLELSYDALAYHPQLTIIPCDFENTEDKYRLGMDEYTYQTYANSVTRIIHCAAYVNHAPDEAQKKRMKKSIVGSARLLIDFAKSNPRPQKMTIDYISTLSTLYQGELILYVKYKQEAEEILKEAANSGDFNLHIIRPGWITGLENTGKMLKSDTDHCLNLLKECKKMGKVPFWFKWNTMPIIYMSPVDYVAEYIIKIDVDDKQQGWNDNLIAKYTWHDIVARYFSSECERISYEKWVAEFHHEYEYKNEISFLLDIYKKDNPNPQGILVRNDLPGNIICDKNFTLERFDKFFNEQNFEVKKPSQDSDVCTQYVILPIYITIFLVRIIYIFRQFPDPVLLPPSPNPRSMDELIEILIKCLQEKYKEENSKIRLFALDDEKALSIADSFINLALIKKEEEREKEEKLNNAQNRNDRLSFSELIYQPNEELPISKLYEPMKAEKKGPSHVLIEGRAGSGKTTLSGFLAYMWAMCTQSEENIACEKVGTWIKQFKLIIFISLRESQAWGGNIKTVGDIVKNMVLNREDGVYLSGNDIEKAINELEKKEEVLYILDGYDEASDLFEEKINGIGGKQDTPRAKLLQSFLSKKYWLLTSRPDRGAEEAAKKEDLNYRHLENIGLTDENLHPYIRLYLNETQTDNLLKYMKSNANLYSIAHIPINLSTLSLAWSRPESQAQLQTGSITLTKIYEVLRGLLIERCVEERLQIKSRLNKNRIPEDERMQRFESKYYETIYGYYKPNEPDFLEALAWQLMQMNQYSFQGKEPNFKRIVETYLPQPSQLDVWDGQEADLGIIKGTYIANRNWYSRTQEFIHLTFQEYFAARYVVKQVKIAKDMNVPCISFGAQKISFFELIAKLKFDRRFEIFWRFVAGSLRDETYLLGKFFKSLQSPPLSLLPIYDYELLLYCSEESEAYQTLSHEILRQKPIQEWLAWAAQQDLMICKGSTYARNFNSHWWLEKALRDNLQTVDALDLLVPWQKLVKSIDININIRSHVITALSFFPLKNSFLYYCIDLLNDNQLANSVEKLLIQQAPLDPMFLSELVFLLPNVADVNSKKLINIYQIRNILQASFKKELPPLVLLQKVIPYLNSTNRDLSHDIAVNTLTKYQKLPSKIMVQITRLLETGNFYSICSALDVLGSQKELEQDILHKVISLLDNKNKEIQERALMTLWRQNPLSSWQLNEILIIFQKDNWKLLMNRSASQFLVKNVPLEKIILINLVEMIHVYREAWINNDELKIDWRIVIAAVEILLAHSQLEIDFLSDVVSLLQYGRLEVRDKVQLLLKDRKNLEPEILNIIVSLLDDNNYYTCVKALYVLKNQPMLDFEIFIKIIELLKDTRTPVREAAAQILKNRAPLNETLLNHVYEILHDQINDGVQSDRPYYSAISQVLEVLSAHTIDVNILCHLLSKIGNFNYTQFDIKQLKIILENSIPLAPSVINQVVALLNHKDKELHDMLLKVLIKQAPLCLKSSILKVKEIFVNNTEDIRSMASIALHCNTYENELSLTKLLNSNDENIRAQALSGFVGQSLNPFRLNQVATFLNDPNGHVRYYALMVLADYKNLDVEILSQLVSFLYNCKTDDEANACQAVRRTLSMQAKPEDHIIKMLVAMLQEDIDYSSYIIIVTILANYASLHSQLLNTIILSLEGREDNRDLWKGFNESTAEIILDTIEKPNALPLSKLQFVLSIFAANKTEPHCNIMHELDEDGHIKNMLSKQPVELLFKNWVNFSFEARIGLIRFWLNKNGLYRGDTFLIDNKSLTIYSPQGISKIMIDEIETVTKLFYETVKIDWSYEYNIKFSEIDFQTITINANTLPEDGSISMPVTMPLTNHGEYNYYFSFIENIFKLSVSFLAELCFLFFGYQGGYNRGDFPYMFFVQTTHTVFEFYNTLPKMLTQFSDQSGVSNNDVTSQSQRLQPSWVIRSSYALIGGVIITLKNLTLISLENLNQALYLPEIHNETAHKKIYPIGKPNSLPVSMSKIEFSSKEIILSGNGESYYWFGVDQPNTHPQTHELTFTYRVYQNMQEIGFARFYKHPIFCRNPEGTRHNIMESGGALTEILEYISTQQIEDVCESLPPTWTESMMYYGVEGLEMGMSRGIGHVAGHMAKKQGFSAYKSWLFDKTITYSSVFTVKYLHACSEEFKSGNDEVSVNLSALTKAGIETGYVALTELEGRP